MMPDDIDQEALDRCSAKYLARHGAPARDPMTACYSEQRDTLRLKVWQEPPCVASESNSNERDRLAQRLLKRLLAAGRNDLSLIP